MGQRTWPTGAAALEDAKRGTRTKGYWQPLEIGQTLLKSFLIYSRYLLFICDIF